jgi:hypothetical protein
MPRKKKPDLNEDPLITAARVVHEAAEALEATGEDPPVSAARLLRKVFRSVVRQHRQLITAARLIRQLVEDLAEKHRRLARRDLAKSELQKRLERQGLTDTQIARHMHCTTGNVLQRRKRECRKKLPKG